MDELPEQPVYWRFKRAAKVWLQWRKPGVGDHPPERLALHEQIEHMDQLIEDGRRKARERV